MKRLKLFFVAGLLRVSITLYVFSIFRLSKRASKWVARWLYLPSMRWWRGMGGEDE